MEPLTGVIQNYAWGSQTALARLRGSEPSDRPEAEMWFGAHPSAPSPLPRRRLSLLDAIERDPIVELGGRVVDRFGARLPYLVKLLAAAEPLSIQAHPTAEQALIGYEREEAAGIPRDAPNRSFRDASHKPELIVALTQFEALVGFREPRKTIEFLSTMEPVRLAPIIERLSESPGLAAAYVLGLAADEVAPLTDALVRSCATPTDEWRDDAHMLVRLAEKYPGQSGVLVASLLNRVVLDPGEALFQGPGSLHAYVGGVGVEIMANSDNVLRGGLTSKHVDVDALLDVVDPAAGEPEVLVPSPSTTRYGTPAVEFEVSRLVSPDGQWRDSDGPQIAVCTEGTVDLVNVEGRITLRSGSAAWIPAGGAGMTIDGSGNVFVVGVPSGLSDP